MYLIFDTETTGLPQNWKAPISDFDNWPRLVQIAWQIHDKNGNLISTKDYIVKPEGFTIPFNAQKIHGISTEIALRHGDSLTKVLSDFAQDVQVSKFIIGHNISFDNNIVGCEFLRNGMLNILDESNSIDTKEISTEFCAIPGGRGGAYKWPSLTELYSKLFGKAFDEAHNAAADVAATARCFLELIRIGVINYENLNCSEEDITKFRQINSKPFNLVKIETKKFNDDEIEVENNYSQSRMSENITNKNNAFFSHLHTHSQFSILQATPNIQSLVDKAASFNMPAIALTDHGNMFGAYKFLDAIARHPVNSNLDNGDQLKLKGILGCELNICKDHLEKSEAGKHYSQVPFLCRNKEGYHNLSKLSSIGFLAGNYYVPRVDKQLIFKHKKGLIALSGGLKGLIPYLILNVGEVQAEEEFRWWVDTFAEDFYVEINRHGIEEEDYVNNILLSFAKKYDVKVIAANNVYYLDKSDSNSHDILLCVKEGQLQTSAKNSGKSLRKSFVNDEFYFKSSQEMNGIFADLPEAIENIASLVQKIESFSLSNEVLLPKFKIPEKFNNIEDEKDGGKRGENAYLRYLTYQGAKDRYTEITDEIRERIDFELKVVESSGYPGYFLIVQDFIAQARKMNVSVGPGRGSAAGSVIAYCTKITNIDPIKYELLFERFLNPERISLPDIDIDFDDEGRGKVIDWVVDKYGKENVAQIITYGSMAAKSSIRDTARVLDLPLNEADKTAKLVPDFRSLSQIFTWSSDELKENLRSEELTNAKRLIDLSKGKDLVATTINSARKLEGSIRNVGTHACGVIITPKPLLDLIPMANAKDSDLMVTQFDNSVVENAGLLKMDFLGLKNLTIIKDCVKIINKIHDKYIDIDNLPLDDKRTFEVFQNGETTGIFQFSSDGMRAHLKQLKPDKFDDLIAMNALYRPGPMEYIPNYIKRKHGKEEIQYDLQEMQEYLKSTYGITVYQEQVMLLSRKLAGFSRGDADMLRKGMGKKIRSVLDDLKPKFLNGCEKNGYDIKIVEKIWTDWEAFASYAFNKSHSTCYALIAYQTAYLKAHYPAELMASVLTNHMRDIKDITHFMEECKRMSLSVLGPDVNESYYKFAVNENAAIRFGLGAIKGVGEGAVEAIVEERKKNGKYTSFDDFMSRVDLRSANKRTIESIACAGGFDSFKLKRSQYFAKVDNNLTYIEIMIKFGNRMKDMKKSQQVDMFGNSENAGIKSPNPPDVTPWNTMELLSKEKEVVGMYISGHPLDDYKFQIENFCNGNLGMLSDMSSIKSRDIRMSVVVTHFEHKETNSGRPYGILSLEDYTSSFNLYLFGDDYINYKSFFSNGWLLYIIGNVRKKYYNDELEFKVGSISLLSELIDKENRDAVLTMDVNEINDRLVDEVVRLVKEYKGKHSLILKLNDHENKYHVDLLSRKYKVDVNKKFISKVNNIPQLNLKIK